MQKAKQKEHTPEKRRRMPTIKRLIWANLTAALVLFTTAVTVLWALGLLSSVIDFFF